MKIKRQITAGMLALAILVLGLFIFSKNEQHTSAQFVSEGSYELPLPHFDGPLPNGDKVSLTEAQVRVPYSIPLPQGLEIKGVWVSTTAADPAQRSVAVQFEGGLLLIIHQEAQSPDWDAVIATAPEFRKTSVNGYTGIGINPGSTEFDGRKYPHPGSVSWWVNGLEITLYSNTLPLQDLLKIAETMSLSTN